jgi:bifunctional ADP-heptose synthase (sugar kinase/adenylyltransferase)
MRYLSIEYIDKVFVFDSKTTLEQHIRNIKPDIMVIGADWKGKTVIGEQYADKLVFFDRIKGYSTTEIINGKTNNI